LLGLLEPLNRGIWPPAQPLKRCKLQNNTDQCLGPCVDGSGWQELFSRFAACPLVSTGLGWGDELRDNLAGRARSRTSRVARYSFAARLDLAESRSLRQSLTRDRALLVGICLDKTGIDCKAFAPYQIGRNQPRRRAHHELPLSSSLWTSIGPPLGNTLNHLSIIFVFEHLIEYRVFSQLS
jgi:hypothetical protein